MHSMPTCLTKLHRPVSGWRTACGVVPKRRSHHVIPAAATQAGADLSSSAVDKDSILADLRAAFSLDAKPESSGVPGVKTAGSPGTANQKTPTSQAQQQRQAPVKRSKHRGRFATLLQSLEKDLLNGTTSSSSSSSSSSGSSATITMTSSSSSSSSEETGNSNSAPMEAQHAPLSSAPGSTGRTAGAHSINAATAQVEAAEPSTSSGASKAAGVSQDGPVPRQQRQRPKRQLPPGPLTFANMVRVEEEERLNPGQEVRWQRPQQAQQQQSGAGTPRAVQQERQQKPQQQQGQQLEEARQQRQPAQRQQRSPQGQQQQQTQNSTQQPRQKRQKEYKPVLKGNLQLPGGPQHSALRRHVVAAGTNPALQTLDAIVIVEGDQDAVALARAVNAPAYVCDGTRAYKDHVLPELRALAALGKDLLVLTDPDERGRDLRVYLDDNIGPLQHSFVSEADATAAEDGPVHAAGNRGIEHAPAAVLQAALRAASRSFGGGRREFTAEWAQAAGLANAFDADEEARDARAPERRRALCAELGLGQCTSAAMLSALNRYFTLQHVEQALARLSC